MRTILGTKEQPMKPIYRLLTIFLIPLLLVHLWIYSISTAVAFADEKVTTFAPVTAEPKPVEISQAPKKGISKWWYALIWIFLFSVPEISQAPKKGISKWWI